MPTGESSESRTVRKPNPAKDVIVAIGLPWLVFFLVVCLFLFTYHDLAPLVWVLVTLCICLALLFLVLGVSVRQKTFIAIGLLCFASTAVATTVGLFISDTYLERYYLLENSDLVHVDATSSPPAQQNIAVFQFAKKTFVDDLRTIGFVAGGDIFCVAPVSAPQGADAAVQFWASGQNCCEMRANFDCGASRDQSTIAVAVEEDDNYNKAINVAQSVYGISSSNASRLVSFVSSAGEVKDDLWDDALSIALAATLLDLLMCVAAGLMLYKVLSQSKPASSRISG